MGLKGFSQTQAVDSLPVEDPIASMLDSLIKLNFMNRGEVFDLHADCSAPHECGSCTDADYIKKLNTLQTPIPMDFNESVKRYIELYAERRKSLTARVLGLSQLYFPIFEEVFDREKLPMEFKYLAVVESALNPTAVSKAGATGIWQFMYPTGKAYGLKVNSFIDERRDVYLSTVAACKYFKDMYAIYQDWLLVIAAYNCGERNVNKAIQRSGGMMNFWQIKRFLPQETQGYVPAFIAVNYVMNFYGDHGIGILPPPISFFETDTIKVSEHTSFNAVASVTGLTQEELRFLNPLYKKNFIPYTGSTNPLILPSSKVSSFLASEQQVYKISQGEGEAPGGKFKYVTSEKKKIHTVRKGETLASIAKKNDCSVAEIKQWNKIKGKTVPTGKKLILYLAVIEKIPINEGIDSTQVSIPDTISVVETAPPASPAEKKNAWVFYVVQPNDTLFSISKKYPGVTVTELKELNKDILPDPNRLTPGKKLRIKQGG